MERLGFGSHIIIDGFQAGTQALQDETHCCELLIRLAEQLEPTPSTLPVSFKREEVATPGISAGLVRAETQLALHTFSAQYALCLDVFSRRNVEVTYLLTELQESFQVGRVESHQISRAKIFPKDHSALLTRLQGDRLYVAARFDNTLLAYQHGSAAVTAPGH